MSRVKNHINRNDGKDSFADSRGSRSLDRNRSLRSSETSALRTRSKSDTRSSDNKAYDSQTFSSMSIPNSLEIHPSQKMIETNGICKVVDYYSKVLGPTVDESILVGLQLLVKNGFLLPNCDEPPPKYESTSDVASQTESSETKTEISQTSEDASTETSDFETVKTDVPIGESEEINYMDYDTLRSEQSEESESVDPQESTETVSTGTPTISSEEIAEPNVIECEANQCPVYTEVPEPTIEEEEPEEPEVVPEEPKAEEPKIEEVPVEPKIEEVPVEPKIEEVSVEPVTEEELPTEGCNILRLSGGEKKSIVMSQDDSKTSQKSLKSPKIISSIKSTSSNIKLNESHTSAVTSEDGSGRKRSRHSVESKPLSDKDLMMHELSNSPKKSLEHNGSKRSHHANDHKQQLPQKESTSSKISKGESHHSSHSSSKASKHSNGSRKELEPTSPNRSRRESSDSDKHKNVSKTPSKHLDEGKHHKSSSDRKDSARSNYSTDRHKHKHETIEEVTEPDVTDDSRSFPTSDSTDRTSFRSTSSVGSDFGPEDIPNVQVRKTSSILKSSISSKSKDSSTDTYVCNCQIHAGGEQKFKEKGQRCLCACPYCVCCDGKEPPVVVPCPFIKAYIKSGLQTPANTERSFSCPNSTRQGMNRDASSGNETKLLCDCYTSTSSSGYTTSSDSCRCMQNGDCPNNPKNTVRYAITKITEYGKFTTFEVMKSTKKVPKFIPKSLEGVFVLKHKT